MFLRNSAVCLFASLLVNAPVQALRHQAGGRMEGLHNPDDDLEGKWLHLSNRISAAQVDNSVDNIKAEYATLPLDHFGEFGDCSKTFENRYWVDDSNYQPGGPVFVYDAGEGNAAQFRTYLNTKGQFFTDLIREFNGVGIVWEHRYYGESTPAKIDLNTPADIMKYLTVDQALADIPTFAATFKRDRLADVDLTPASTPWVFVGGSYPGIRAAFTREKYPDSIFASWAASAPVQAKVDMSSYYETIARGMQAFGLDQCYADIQTAIAYMDMLMESPLAADALKRQFLGESAVRGSNGGFGLVLSKIFNYWQNDLVGKGPTSLGAFCNWLEMCPGSNSTCNGGNLTAPRTAAAIVDRWASWKPFPTIAGCGGPESTSNSTSGTCDLDMPNPEANTISWMWQYCTEFGFLQSGGGESHGLVSKWMSLEWLERGCHQQFLEASRKGMLPPLPQAGEVNAEYDGWDIRPTNTYWTGGEFDPWLTLESLSYQPYAPRPNTTVTPPQCGEAPPDDQLFGMVLPNRGHCGEFLDDKEALEAQELFVQALRTWLPCFEKKSREQITPATCESATPPLLTGLATSTPPGALSALLPLLGALLLGVGFI